MKQFIDKLIERLEEEVTATKTKCPVNVEFDIGIYKSIEIVNQLAEEYATDINVGNKLQTIDVSELLGEQGNGGWIPCSELPEEEGFYLCTVFHADDYVVWIMRFNDGEFLKPDDVEDWDYELLAWKPIIPYQPKGE